MIWCDLQRIPETGEAVDLVLTSQCKVHLPTRWSRPGLSVLRIRVLIGRAAPCLHLRRKHKWLSPPGQAARSR